MGRETAWWPLTEAADQAFALDSYVFISNGLETELLSDKHISRGLHNPKNFLHAIHRLLQNKKSRPLSRHFTARSFRAT